MSDSMRKCFPGRSLEEIVKLRDSMPKINGYIVHPKYLPRNKRAGYEEDWRDWCKKNPKRDWHPMLEDWAKIKASYDEKNI